MVRRADVEDNTARKAVRGKYTPCKLTQVSVVHGATVSPGKVWPVPEEGPDDNPDGDVRLPCTTEHRLADERFVKSRVRFDVHVPAARQCAQQGAKVTVMWPQHGVCGHRFASFTLV